MVEQIRSDTEVDWSEVFQRVNKNQKTLKEQELRHARFDGWFINRAEKEVEEQEFWKDIGVSSRTRNARMKDVEFISILMLSILEQKFVGFPQWRIDELYAKYDFSLTEIPEDEAAKNYEEDEGEGQFADTTQEDIAHFESHFESVRNKVFKMESRNKCITNHKKRLFTDLYSLWCLLAFEADLLDLASKDLAEKYDSFITSIDSLYDDIKNNRDTTSYTPEQVKYHANSTGAGTEEDSRRNRHEALKKAFFN